MLDFTVTLFDFKSHNLVGSGTLTLNPLAGGNQVHIDLKINDGRCKVSTPKGTELSHSATKVKPTA